MAHGGTVYESPDDAPVRTLSLPLRAQRVLLARLSEVWRPDRIDVLFVSTELAVGGAEHQVVELAVRLAGRGWAVAVVSLKPPRIALDRLSQAGVGVQHLGLDRAVRLPRALRNSVGSCTVQAPALCTAT